MQQKSCFTPYRLTASEVRRTVLANGLTVVTERIPHVRSVSLGIWIRAGSLTDGEDTLGMAHFIEHMAFKGTERRNAFEIADTVESLGGSLNAFTERDMTCYYATVLDEHVEIAFDVLADMLTHSRFENEDIEREKNVVLEEIRSAEDVPEELAQDIFGDAALSPDPVSKPILGTIETVQSLDRESITKYLSSHYSNRSVVVAVAGNIDHQRIVELASSCLTLSDMQYVSAYQDNKTIYKKNIRLKKDIQQAHICYGFRTFGYIDDKRIPLRILMTIIGGGMSSRLFQNLRERHGLCYTVYSYSELLRSIGFVATYAATESSNVGEVTKLIEDEHHLLSHSILDEETLERTKSHLVGSMILGLESTSNRMNRLARHEFYLGSHCDINDTIDRINSVDKETILGLAEEVFNPEGLRTVVVTE